MKKILKKYLIIVVLILLSCGLFSQDYKMWDTDLVFTFGPLGMLNTQENSAPSPIVFSLGAGANIRMLQQLSITPHATFFANYYLLDGDKVLPAEIEHRSAYVPSIMLDIPATWDLRTQNTIFRVGAGVSLLFRFAFLANDVPDTVQDEIDTMNSLLYKGGEFFYPSVHISWDRLFDQGITVGIGAKAYLPVGSLGKDLGLHNGIASIGIRLGIN